jgi:hypothetical protein
MDAQMMPSRRHAIQPSLVEYIPSPALFGDKLAFDNYVCSFLPMAGWNVTIAENLGPGLPGPRYTVASAVGVPMRASSAEITPWDLVMLRDVVLSAPECLASWIAEYCIMRVGDDDPPQAIYITVLN